MARELVTPEGVDLRLQLGSFAERALALIIDLVIVNGAMIALSVAAYYAFAGADDVLAGEAVAIIWLVGSFVARNLYFVVLEGGARGATWGKRIMRLRVASRSGAALTVNALIARNAMREIELYMPILFLISRGYEIEALIILAGVVWCGVFVLFPLFNRDRLRAGDLVAGTWVVRAPRRRLLPDMAAAEIKDARLVFATEQVSVYGVKELQVLESVLRANVPEAMAAVAERIRGKIRWTNAAAETDREFLDSYYAALRRRLEQRMLFGKRKADKFDAT